MAYNGCPSKWQLKDQQRGIKERLSGHRAQRTRQALADLTEQRRQLAALQEELAKARDLNSRQLLAAPVSGRVQSLSVATVGGVVTPAQQLMLIVPDEEQLEVEVLLENKDIGFVREGMAAVVKVHTFPFTKYGVIEALVTQVSDDAVVDEHNTLRFNLRLSLARNNLQVDERLVRLQPGMAVSAEVKTRERRIMDFFLSPIQQYAQEGLRER